MTATLHADLVKRLRALHAELVESDGGECEATALYREAADAIESLERQLAAIREEQRRCGICGGLVDLRNAEKSSVSIGVGNHVKQRARHRERMKEGTDVSVLRS